MNTARIVVLAIAIGAGGIAAYLASGSDDKPAPAQPVAQLQTVDILVAKSDIGLGRSVKPDDLQWQTWPAATASSSFISRASKADAIKEITGSIARSPFIAGEPIREQKLVKADGSGFMAAILPAGYRAISTEISPETGAGGFILPNDRVDVLRTYGNDEASRSGGADVHMSETILSNTRVLPRVPVAEANFFGIVISIQQKSGGNLSEGPQQSLKGVARPPQDGGQNQRHEHGRESVGRHHRVPAVRRRHPELPL